MLLAVSFLELSSIPIKANPEERYQVSGDEQGKVTVVDADSGEVVRTFQIDEGGVIEETFVLDEGKTIAAAQNQQTVFWNLETGEEIGRVQGKMYSLFEAENRIFTHQQGLRLFPQDGQEEKVDESANPGLFSRVGTTFTYKYPELDSKCRVSNILEELKSGDFRLSSDGHYLAVQFANPVKPEGQVIIKDIPSSGLYDLQSCSEVKLADHPIDEPMFIGLFSEDSRYYLVENVDFLVDGSYVSGTVKFDLQTGEIVEKFPEIILGQ